jgi:hypothetical protein
LAPTPSWTPTDTQTTTPTGKPAHSTSPTPPAYLITQATSTTILQQGDTILYQTADGIHTGTITTLTTSHSATICLVSTDATDHLIHTEDIVGRITSTLHDDPWTLLCLHLWDLTTHTLNPAALLNL